MRSLLLLQFLLGRCLGEMTNKLCSSHYTQSIPITTIGAPAGASVAPCFPPGHTKNVEADYEWFKSRPNTCWYSETTYLHPPIETSVACGGTVTYFLHQQETMCENYVPVEITRLATRGSTYTPNTVESPTRTPPGVGCAIIVGSADLSYFAAPSTSRDMCATTPSVTAYSAPKIERPGSLVMQNTTLYANSVYLSFDTLYAETTFSSGNNLVTSRIGRDFQNTVLPFRSEDISSIRYKSDDSGNIGVHQFNYADLMDPVPLSAWHTQLSYYQNKDDHFTMDFWANGPAYFPSSRSGYALSASVINPYLAIPSKVTELDPLWTACRISDGIIFDPPKVVTEVVGGALASPTLLHTAHTAVYSMQPMPGADIPNPASARATQAPSRSNSDWVSRPNDESSIQGKLLPTVASSRSTPPSAVVVAGSVTLIPGQAAATLMDGRIVSAGQNAIVIDTSNGRVRVPYAGIPHAESSRILNVGTEDLNNGISSALGSGFRGDPGGSFEEGFGKSAGERSSIAALPPTGPIARLTAIPNSGTALPVKSAAAQRYMIGRPAVYIAGLISVTVTLW